MPDWNWQKIRQKLSSTLSLNFRFLKTICYLYPRYHPETIDDILKNAQKKTATVLITLYDKSQWKWNWKGKIDHMDAAQIDLGLDINTNIPNIKCVSI